MNQVGSQSINEDVKDRWQQHILLHSMAETQYKGSVDDEL